MLFVLAAVSNEFSGFRVQAVSWNAWFALIYLIIAGSIVGFTAYVWLLHYESPTKVGTYAYVNPVVAVCLGILFRRGSGRSAHAAGDVAGFGERNHDHYDAKGCGDHECEGSGG